MQSGLQYLATACLGILLLAGCTQRDKAVGASKSSVPAPVAATSGPSELEALFELSLKGQAGSQAAPQFRDVATSSGICFQRFSDVVPKRYFLPEVMGGGVAWCDFDCDGRLDLYTVNGRSLWGPHSNDSEHVNRLYRGLSNSSFADITFASRAGDCGFGQGCSEGDFNSDGFPDLYVTNYGRNTLLANNGDGTFEDVTEQAGVGDESWGTSAVWFDADGDGDADLYVVNYLDVTRANHQICTYGGVEGYCGPGQWRGVDDVLYLNIGDGRFQTAPRSEAAATENAKGLAVAVVDFDDDSVPEIYVGNDMAPNFLLTRLPGPRSGSSPLFRNVADAAGCAISDEGRNEASMGIACADFDGDGRVDIFLTHYFHHKNTLYRNLGSLLFEDDSRRSRTAATSYEALGFGTVSFDVDCDGDEDLFIANGHVLGPEHTPNEMRPQLLENNGRGVFTDLADGIGDYFAKRFLGRGVAKGDYDNDGRIDLAVSHIDRPLALLHNETERPYHFIGLGLLPSDRVYPSGGRVIATAADLWQRVVPIVGGGSYLSSSDGRIVVGLGAYEGPVQIEVIWPGRTREDFGQLSPDRYWMIPEHGRAVAPAMVGSDSKRVTAQALASGYDRRRANLR